MWQIAAIFLLMLKNNLTHPIFIMESTLDTNASLIQKFLKVGKAEGYSYLALLLIAMPLKYIAHLPIAVRIAGSLHGILFIAFMYFILQMYLEKQLSLQKAAYAFLLSLLPFGTFYLKKLL